MSTTKERPYPVGEFTLHQAAALWGVTPGAAWAPIKRDLDAGLLTAREEHSETKDGLRARKRSVYKAARIRPVAQDYVWLDEVPGPREWPVTREAMSNRWGIKQPLASARLRRLEALGFIERRLVGPCNAYREATAKRGTP